MIILQSQLSKKRLVDSVRDSRPEDEDLHLALPPRSLENARLWRDALEERVTFEQSPLAANLNDNGFRLRAKVVLAEYMKARELVVAFTAERTHTMLEERVGTSYTLNLIDFVADVELAAHAAFRMRPNMLLVWKVLLEKQEDVSDVVLEDFGTKNPRHFGTMLDRLGQELRKRNITCLRAHIRPPMRKLTNRNLKAGDQ